MIPTPLPPPARRSVLPCRPSAITAAASLVLLAVALTTLVSAPRPAAGSNHEPADLDVTMAITVASPVVVGSGSVAGPIEITLLSADGEEIATGGTTSRAGVSWRATLRDAAGNFTGPWPGQSLLVSSAESSVVVAVPDVALNFDRDGNSVTGTTAPGMAVRLLFGDGEVGRAEGIADAAGTFRFSFTDGPPLRGGAPVTVTLTLPGNHESSFARPVPHAVLSLHPGDVYGGARPGSRVRVGLFNPDHQFVAGGESVADDRGRFSTWLRDRRGELVRAKAGQRVQIADSDQTFEVSVPSVTGEYDLQRNLLRGTGVPGETVSLVVWNPYFPDYEQPEGLVDAAGNWEIDPGIGIHPGTHFYVTQHLPSGDEVFYCLQIPALHVQTHSPLVHVEALWDVEAHISLLRFDEKVAGASGVATYEGGLSLTLLDAAGQPVAVQPGDRLTATLDGVARSFPIGVLSASLGADGQLRGVAPPGTEVAFDSRRAIERVVVAETGEFAFDASDLATLGWARPGESFQVYSLTATADHFRVSFVGPSLATKLQSKVVSGSVMPGVPVRLRRWSADDPPEEALGASEADGSFDLSLERPVAPGDTLVLETGPVSTTLSVPLIEATYDPRSGVLTGLAPPYEVLEVQAVILDAAFPHRTYVTTDEHGAWRLELLRHGRGQPIVDPERISGFTVRYSADANAVRLTVPGPFAYPRRIYLPSLGAGPLERP